MNVDPELPPPEYTDFPTSHDELPPDYSLGGDITIGNHTLHTPLVNMAQVTAHLSLLHAIRNLKSIIEAGKDTRIPQEALDLSRIQRWAWFVGLAVER